MISPFFILGNPRSGTSLLRLILNSHPAVVVPPESGFLQWWYKKYGNWDITDTLDKKKVVGYVEDVLTSRKIENWDLDRDELISSILRSEPRNYSELSTIVYLNYKRKLLPNDRVIVGDKNNYYIRHLETLHLIYPQSKYIHLVRDGRDVACSYRSLASLKTESEYKPQLSSDIEEIALEWSQNVERIDAYLTNKERIKIRYEDLLSNAKNTLSGICSFLGVPYCEQMLGYHRPELNDEPISTRDWKMKTLEPIDASNTKKYPELLSQDEIATFNKIGSRTLANNGYES